MTEKIAPIDLTKSVGPALQEDIASLNKAFIDLLLTAARLGDAEPLAPAILGIPREILDELAMPGKASILKAKFFGLPLVELRIKDPRKLKLIIESGFGSTDAVAEITKSMPLELISKK